MSLTTSESLAYLLALALLLASLYLLGRLRRQGRVLGARLSALQARLNFARLTTEISTQFINRPSEQLDAGILQALERLGDHAAVDRGYIFLASTDESRLVKTYTWQRPGLAENLIDELVVADFAWGIHQLQQNGFLHMPHPQALPAVAANERRLFAQQKLQSLLCIALHYGDKLAGFLGFATVRAGKQWSDDDIASLRIVGQIFANALERKKGELEKERLENQLRQAQKLESIGTLAGGIAHDFNNILGAIMGYGEMALSALPKRSRPYYHVQQVMTASQRAKAVVDQILAFSRSGRRQRQSVAVRGLLEETLELLRASLPTTVTIQLRLAAENVTVQGDPVQLQQVLMNLCTNAAQAMHGRGRLEVALETRAPTQPLRVSHGVLPAGFYACIQVQDTGQGMDESTLGRIFDPFFTTKAVGSGTGLGLSMVHGIVTDHGGAMQVRSEPGQGSLFECYLPADLEENARAADHIDSPLRVIPQGHGETILLVDDEPTLVELGEEMLALLGYEPVGFSSSRQALAAFVGDPGRFDLVMTDEVMPELTGTRLARRLHRLRPELPILLVTGYSGPVSLEEAQHLGIREVLKKPLQTRELAESIARHLSPKVALL